MFLTIDQSEFSPSGEALNYFFPTFGASVLIGTLRYEDGKATTATAVDGGNFRGSRRTTRNKMLKTCIFGKDGDVHII